MLFTNYSTKKQNKVDLEALDYFWNRFEARFNLNF